MITKKAYLVKEKSFEIREEELTINDDQVLIQIKFCGLCNWELNHWKGTSEKFRAMYPDSPGHEWVGIVVETGKNVTNVQVGDAVTVLRAAKPEAGDFGLILGCGPMGLWCTQALSGNLLGGLIEVDVDDAKLELAKKYGATHTINSKNEDVKEAVKKITNGRKCDFVIEGTGIPKL